MLTVNIMSHSALHCPFTVPCSLHTDHCSLSQYKSSERTKSVLQVGRKLTRKLCVSICISITVTPAGPMFANSDEEESSDDEDPSQKKQVRFTVTRERAEELVSSLCGVIWKQKSHSWSEVCTGVAALTKTDGKKIRDALQALAAVIKLNSELTTDGKYIYRIEEGGDRIGFQVDADFQYLSSSCSSNGGEVETHVETLNLCLTVWAKLKGKTV